MSEQVKAIHELETTAYNPPPKLDEAISAIPLVETPTFKPKKIGYLTNYSFHIWYQILIEIMKRRAKQYGAELIVLDAHLSVENQLDQAEEMITQVDAIVLTPAATSGLESILEMAKAENVPVVVEANPVIGQQSLVAICDYDAGYGLGVWVGENVKNEDGQPLRILDVGLPTLRPCLLRSEGFVDGVRSLQPEAIVVASINGEATPSIARKISADILKEKGDVDVIFAMDDETGQGAYQGYVAAGFDPDKVVLAGFGLAGEHEKDWLLQRQALKVSAAMFPEYVALRCIDDVMRLGNGAISQVRDVIPTIPMTPENLDQFYKKIDGFWTPNFEAVAALPTQATCTKE